MGILTEEMKRVVTEVQLCYAATITPDGKPNLSPKGSITVLSDDEFGFADLASPGTIENLRHNPAIEQWRAPPGSSEGPRHLRHYGALGLRRGRALARRQIPSTAPMHPASFSMPTERQAEEVAGPEKGNVFEIVGNGSSTSMRFDYIPQSKRKHTSGSS